MCLKVLGNVVRCNQGIALLAMIMVLVGCSSGMQRFANPFSYPTISNQPNISTTMSTYTDSPTLSYGAGMIQSTELPPVEPVNDLSTYDNTAYNSPPQDGTSSPNSRIMGTPPRNLGTLSRSQMRNDPLFRQNSYIVQTGDTLLSIARQRGVSVEALKLVNGIRSNSIYIGQVLMIPSGRTAETSNVRNNDWGASKQSLSQSQSASSIRHKKYSSTEKAPITPKPSAQINRSNGEQNSSAQMSSLNYEKGVLDTVMNKDNGATPQATGISKMRWPVRGRLLSQFGQKRGTTMSRGIDIAVPEGSSVKAAENGIVIYASDGLKELGNVVMIRHENNIITIYGCNSKLVVTRGQRIRRGDEIAKSGVSGDVKTPRVYFEVRENSLPVDPIKYLEN
ncbi:peptidase M23 [Bartonella henselae]|uniref:Putative virulence determinant n=1 Tax=Bartonella henselae TaxID=38323 RepID=X5M6Q2_BARHN|nr:M23 family metallopeptidase [Bartonella henselae]MDM9996302.1 peptidoglycan DD-metalloendopeptidase family protein [Bartonella henselae]OLL48386.1 peptidase M23 [Bartonella henselae]OLL48714.1 peptidase M23 [Bartonella henselae]OLL49808.1 peptidase M23 [Bartonella henselae]OLL57361.1 peptidase M23 [Bartonella henselae]